MKRKVIAENEEFEMDGRVFAYSKTDTGGVALRVISNSSKKVKPSFIPPTKKEVGEYFESKGYIRAIGEKAWEYYSAGDWHNGVGKPIRNWRQTMVANWMRDEHKIKQDAITVIDNFFQK